MRFLTPIPKIEMPPVYPGSRLWQAYQAIPGPVRQVETIPSLSIANSIDTHTSIDS